MSEEKDNTALGEESALAYSDFVKCLDNWLRLLVKRGGSEKYIVDLMKDRVGRNVGANVAYFTRRAMSLEKEGSYAEADHYMLVAKLYDKVFKN